MSLLLLLRSETSSSELKNTKIKLISGHLYRLTFKVRATTPQTITVKMQNSTGLTVSLNSDADILEANTWQTIKKEFTAGASDDDSVLRLLIYATPQSIWFDKFNLIDLTIERKEYRIMRIQGSVLPGSFIQILTLREKTANETA